MNIRMFHGRPGSMIAILLSGAGFWMSGGSDAAVSLSLNGDPNAGYYVEIAYDGISIARHRRSGELSLVLENSNHTLSDEFMDWKPVRAEVSAEGRKIKLTGQLLAKTISARAELEVMYSIVNDHVVQKEIILYHRYGPRMYYRLVNALEAIEKPVSFWTFSQMDNSSGGAVREPFPAMGFKTSEGITVGLLTDNGVKNLWTRANTMFDLDPSKGLVTIDRVPDPELTWVADNDERSRGEHYVAFKFGELHLKDIRRNGKSVVEAYHPLDYRAQSKKTVYIFAEPIQSQRDLKIACQTHLAEGHGFSGTMAEKILYADTQMLTWIDEPVSLSAYQVPSLGYQMLYQRDAFWMAASLLDKRVAEETWTLIKHTQDETGAVCCHYIPYRWHEGMPGGQTDANIHWIVWAYINKMRYGSSPDINALSKNLQFIRKTFCKGKPGEYGSLSAGWFDVFALKERVLFSHMQGEFAVALRCAKELGLDVSDSEIKSAAACYKECYDPEQGYIPFGQSPQFKQMLSPTTLLPEFMSLWLFDEPMLSDEAVADTLDSIDRVWNKKRAGGFAVPNIIRNDGEFQSKENKTFAESLWWEPGIYHNGGSWLLYEYLAYVVGHRHGWKPTYVGTSALERMNRRLELEFSEELEPVSHEYIPLTKAIDTPGSVWEGSSDLGVPGPPGSKVFGWNSFVIIANEVAGIRPPQDPIIMKNRENRKNTKEGISPSHGKQ